MEVVVSPGTLEELSQVLRRPHIVSRYGITETEAEEFIQGLRDFALVAPGKLSLDVVVSDPKDNHVLAAAVETQCDFLVTGDKHLLTLVLFESLRIVTPRDLLYNLHNPEAEEKTS
ncbi:MAG: putative toxin-antitoxin system toxin component, PIN family [Armatimonadetes bacterium CG2_30_59_28]|nr:putative toxin-antitoxin system toxin component, PIN family [Armatimonadota bacterium]OIO91811.1 MAG: putative toxin-antitoxin system toxin component, PIN family [Armatimonadetes bacterium CG2_30_59_28]PJB74241.1 MAG: putative toxin-antitoxin system toxin component, PIN family [Armatimonadetes bacterium CG_4_9_14_3_um_filter_58_7]